MTSWKGYLRPDGTKGVRDILLVVYTVECARFVAEKVAADEDGVHCIGYAPCNDNDYAIRTLLALSRHPNAGGALFIGLGCEYTRPERLCDATRASGRPADWFLIQETGGTPLSIAEGKRRLAELRGRMDETRKTVPMTWKDLSVGCECGGSDATSGLAGNPLVGRFFDRLTDRGGTAIFEEMAELVGLLPELRRRAASPRAEREIEAAYENMVRYCRSVRQYSISPGNFAGGLSTIEEKSCGAFAKSGSRPIQGVLRVAQRPPHPGLWLLDSLPDPYFMQYGYSNPHDTEGLMDLLAAGCQAILFVTGRGSPVGAPLAPVIKITGNSGTFIKMSDDMDLDAGPILSGERSFDLMADELETLVASVCAGEPTKSERLGHREFSVECKYQDATGRRCGERAGDGKD
jgi:altronate hydrolase